MRKFILFVVMLITVGTYAGIEKTIKAKIEKVTVFLNGAQLHRTLNTTINQGTTTLVIESLETGIDPKSIQASGTGNFIILDVKHRIKYPETDPTSKSISKNSKVIILLEDSIKQIDYELEEISNKQEVLNTEKKILLNNRVIKGDSKNDTLPVLKDALIYLREKLYNINGELLKLKKSNQSLTDKKTRIQTTINELKNAEYQHNSMQNNSISHQVLLTVSAEATTSCIINFSYTVQNAGWTPSYDLRTISSKNIVQLTYKAHVYQSTGIDWNDVKLTLSTNNPFLPNTRSVLPIQYITYFNTYSHYQKKTNSPASTTLSKSEKVMSTDLSTMAIEEEAKTAAEYTQIQETMLNYEYQIKLAYTIPSDGQSHIVAVQNKEIPSTFEHFSIPKTDNNAFLLAKLSDWDDLNLIHGTATIFFDGSYVGETYIDPQNTNDTLELSLGRDRSIVTTRIKLKDKTKEKILADEKVKTVTYEITIRNTKSVSSTLTLEDQIPVSQNKEIKVELLESSGGQLSENTGKLNWKLSLKPKETKKILISYEVKYPKDKVLAGM